MIPYATLSSVHYPSGGTTPPQPQSQYSSAEQQAEALCRAVDVIDPSAVRHIVDRPVEEYNRLALHLSEKGAFPLIQLLSKIRSFRFSIDRPTKEIVAVKKLQAESIIEHFIATKVDALCRNELICDDLTADGYKFIAYFLAKEWDNLEETRRLLLQIYKQKLAADGSHAVGSFFESISTVLTGCIGYSMYSVKAYQWLNDLGVDFNQPIIYETHWCSTEETIFLKILKNIRADSELHEAGQILSFMMLNGYNPYRQFSHSYFEEDELDYYKYSSFEQKKHDSCDRYFDNTGEPDCVVEYLLLKKFDNLTLSDESLMACNSHCKQAVHLRSLLSTLVARTCYSKKAIERIRLLEQDFSDDYTIICSSQCFCNDCLEKSCYVAEWFMETAPTPRKVAEDLCLHRREIVSDMDEWCCDRTSEYDLTLIPFYKTFVYSLLLSAHTASKFKRWAVDALHETISCASRTSQSETFDTALRNTHRRSEIVDCYLKSYLFDPDFVHPKVMWALTALGFKPEGVDEAMTQAFIDKCTDENDLSSKISFLFVSGNRDRLTLEEQCMLDMIIDRGYFNSDVLERLPNGRRLRHTVLELREQLKDEVDAYNFYRPLGFAARMSIQ